MVIFLAGASGAVGRRLVPLLLNTGHVVTGTTRSPTTAEALRQSGVNPVVLDIFDAAAVTAAMRAARPEIVIDQLTDFPKDFNAAAMQASFPRNVRLYREGTRNLIEGARAAGAQRLIAQSYAFAYSPGGEPHLEEDALNLADPIRGPVIAGVAEMERLLLAATDIGALILRYGLLYGSGTWSDTAPDKPALHIDAAAHAALLATECGAPGIYNIADDDGAVSIAKARRELGFDPAFRLG